MKKLLLLALAACIPFSMVMAAPDPANFQIVYGNQDGSVLMTGLDRDLNVQIWGATAASGPDLADSVSFVHMPLMSEDEYITARNGGFFPATGLGLWDDKSFLGIDNHVNVPAIPVGFTSQSVLGFAYLTDPRDPQNFIYTLGAYQLLATFAVHTTANVAYLNTTQCPFSQGLNGPNGGLLWGMSNGIDGVVPTQTYGCIFFNPNTDPVWTVFPAGPLSVCPRL